MTDPSTFLNKGLSHAKEAIQFDKLACKNSDPDDFSRAKESYISAAQYYVTAVKYEKNEHTKTSLREKAANYLDRAQVMKDWLTKYEARERENSEARSQNTSNGGGPGAAGGTVAKSKEQKDDKGDEGERMRSQLDSAVLSEKPNVKWDDVAGLEQAKDALKEAVILPQRFPQMFVGKRRPWKGILLYGPPGTGKSFLAKAVATEADAKFFSVSSSDLMSKWQGESEKLVKELFSMARASGKAIIFIDEIDALVSSRSSNESESSRRIKTEFLVQMDGVGKSTEGVLLLGATNIPWGLDDALLRRMERRIYIPLPDRAARARMFELNLGNTPNALQKEDFLALADMSDGYSGSDIAVVVRDAIMQPVRTLQNATKFKEVVVHEEGKGPVTKLTPCSPGDPEGRPMALMNVKPDDLLVPPIVRADFEKALMSSKPSVGRENIKKHEDFTNEKGLSGV